MPGKTNFDGVCGWAPFENFTSKPELWNAQTDRDFLDAETDYKQKRQEGLDKLQDAEEPSSQPGQGLGYKIVGGDLLGIGVFRRAGIEFISNLC